MSAEFSVAGRIACVTGASSGLGRAIADALQAAGAQVVGVARRPLEGLACVAADLSDLEAIPDIARRVAAVHGAPQILFNAAGVNTRETADEVTLAGWRTTMDLNLAAPFFLAQALVPGMRAAGYGRIVNFASLQSRRAFPGGISYGASKGGIAQLTRAMAEAWSRHGITANALAPGFFPTELTGPVFGDPERAARNAAQTCIGRNGTLEDIVGPAVFLASPASAYVTGQLLYVDGGFTAK
ncbi:SDR family oxidoreductase [Stappia sp.]|uniref:SDR family NAD(P)-dependent oxidoreductase n=1 Tax=Stappia sp. TaxID=1870903 RepID=UPI0032D90521